MSSNNGTAQRAAASTILDVVPQINRWAETRVSRSAEGFRLSLRQLSALSMIEDEKTTLGDVARALQVTPGSRDWSGRPTRKSRIRPPDQQH